MKTKVTNPATNCWFFVLNYYLVFAVILLSGCNQGSQPNPNPTNSNPTTNQTTVSTPSQNDAINPRQENLGNALIRAVLFEDESNIVALLNQGADVNYMNVGLTPLDVAIKHDRQELVTLLRERGGKTALELGNANSTGAIAKTAVVFTQFSTGYDWQRADDASKRQFCDTIAVAMSKEFKRDFTGDFYLEALDSFNNTAGPNNLNQNIHTVVGLVTSAAMNDAAQ